MWKDCSGDDTEVEEAIDVRRIQELGIIKVKPRHQRSLHATKFEDRSHEETERQERCAQSKA